MSDPDGGQSQPLASIVWSKAGRVERRRCGGSRGSTRSCARGLRPGRKTHRRCKMVATHLQLQALLSIGGARTGKDVPRRIVKSRKPVRTHEHSKCKSRLMTEMVG